MHINSGFRCPEVGGNPDSQHLTGNAVDVEITDDEVRSRFVRLAFVSSFVGIGIGKGIVHLDCRYGTPVLWTYPL